MSVYQKFKTVTRLQLFGDDDVLASNTNSVYKTEGSNFTNGKRMRFNLKGAMNDVRLSKRARMIMEATFIPLITNMNTTIVRVVTSSEDKVWDSKKGNAGNPILVTFRDPNNQVLNCSEYFYNINIPSNFLQSGYIDLEIESTNTTANIDFITSAPLTKFFITVVIIDEDDVQTQDPNLAPPVDLKLYGRLGQSFRPSMGSFNVAGISS